MKKDKAVVIESPSTNEEEEEEEEEEEVEDDDEDAAAATNPPARRFSTRNASSKYDFVKVKVWLGDNADHYYVLSRFLLSRMLTVTKIPNHVAIKIALELKKLLVDNSLLDVSQSDLEANLFKVPHFLFSVTFPILSELMERRGFGEEYINRYKMMTRFHHMRVPLVILVCGTASVGKSTIATQLAQRLNLPNVLQTAMVYELLRTSTDAPLASSPVWARDFSSSEELITEFCRECRIVRKGLAGDLKKAIKDGKPIIIEEGEGGETGEVPEQIVGESASIAVSEEFLLGYAVQAKHYQ
ncbi:putative NAD(P)H-dependent oxidoreductase 1-like [Capsicum annuum]|nr:putative NAD(P)H-dependent oxidoreductase 1-like [Capsicum annuum]KAF3669712.1 putative NAD(P)H-dependent oxidoreductase 1-like [Capsicum annuum]